MKFLFEFLMLGFVALFVIRLIEMSITFDWVDVLWTGVFFIFALFSGAAFASARKQ